MLSFIAAVLVFGIIILIHEFGHFLFAKLGGIGVVEFSIGMGPRLFSFEKGGTRYSLKLLPFGGSCMMVGEDEDDVREDSFNNKSVWTRISVIVAGPVFNFILAFILAFVIIQLIGYDPPTVSSVAEGYPAADAGIQQGDTITKIDDKKIVFFRDMTMYLLVHPDKSVEVQYLRDGKTYETTITPKFSEENGMYMLGIGGGARRSTGSVFSTLRYSASEIRYWVSYAYYSLGMMVSGQVKADDIMGPVRIVSLIDDTVQQNRPYGGEAVFLSLANLCVLLSSNLGFMNLLPIPALDGGRLVFLIIEAVRGKPIDREKEGMIHMAGMAMLMVLMVFILFNDIRLLF